jgi:tetratricopeptide (TPR) repeat protein
VEDSRQYRQWRLPRRLRSMVRRAMLASGILALAATAMPRSQAAEPAAAFVEALRQRGWNDTALEYLEHLDQSRQTAPPVSDDFRKTIPFEKGRTLAAMALQPGQGQRDLLQQRAVEQFQIIAREYPDTPQAIDALSQAGNLLSQQAMHALIRMEKIPAQVRAGQRTNVSGIFDQAISILQELQQLIKTQLAALNKSIGANSVGAPSAGPPRSGNRRATGSTRNRKGDKQQESGQNGVGPSKKNEQQKADDQDMSLRSKLAETQFLRAKLLFEKSRIYPADSSAGREVLQLALKAFSELAKEHENNLTGFYGKLYIGRCHQALGEPEQALRSYEELVYQPIQNPLFRRLVARAMRHRAECLLLGNKHDDAISECRKLLKQSRASELRLPEWVALKYQLALVLLDKSRSNSKEGGHPKGNANLQSTARSLMGEVAKEPGQFQLAAKTVLASLASSESSSSDASGDGSPNNYADAKNFADALAAGKSALDQMNSAKLAARLAKENNPEAVEQLQGKLLLARENATRLFQQAIQLADSETEPDQLNLVRYYLCWLFWEGGQLQEAAVLGEFLARNYPENQHALVATKIAMAAYQRLANESAAASSQPPGEEGSDSNKTASDRSNATERLNSLAAWVIQHWPNSSEAADASTMLIHMAVRNGDLKKAEHLLSQLPEVNRAAAGLSLGSALWVGYLQNQKQTDDSEATAATAQLQPSMLERAERYLRQGFEHASSLETDTTPAQASGALYLAQLLLTQGQAEQALEVLEKAPAGPLVLLREETAAAQKKGFAEQTYKTALRAYATIQPPMREQVMAMIDALEGLTDKGDAANNESQQGLIQLYVGIGVQLQKQVDGLVAAGKHEQARQVTATFKDLLDRAERHGSKGDWNVRNWIAQTAYQLGMGLQQGDSPGDQTRGYLQQAQDAYASILEQTREDPKFAPNPTAILGVQKRLADCKCGLGKYSEALELYAEILRQKPNLLELQKAAATTLELWGTNKEDPEVLNRAIRGDMPQANHKNLIWGWLRLASIADYAARKAAQGEDPAAAATRKKITQYQDLFFEARYHAARARYLAAQLANGAAQDKQLRTVRQSIESLAKIYPELGGKQWKQKFEDLLQELGDNGKR